MDAPLFIVFTNQLAMVSISPEFIFVVKKSCVRIFYILKEGFVILLAFSNGRWFEWYGLFGRTTQRNF